MQSSFLLSFLSLSCLNMELTSTMFKVHELTRSKNVCVSFFQNAGILPKSKLCANNHKMCLNVSEIRKRW